MPLCPCPAPIPAPSPTRLYLLVARVSDPEVACGLPQSGAHGSRAAPAAAPPPWRAGGSQLFLSHDTHMEASSYRCAPW